MSVTFYKNLLPNADDSIDIGVSDNQFKNLYIDGTAYIDTLSVSSLVAESNLDIGAFSLQALNFVSDVATGTSPYACTSTTVNTNLNADLLDGNHAAAFITSLTPWTSNINAAGYTLYGSDAVNGDLTLEGTSSATKTTSYIVLQPTAGNVGIGTITPAYTLDIVGSLHTTTGITNNLFYRDGLGTTMKIFTGRESSFNMIYTSATDGGAVTDVTTNLSQTSIIGTTILNTNAYRLYIGSSATFTTIGFWLTTLAVGATLIVEYWNGSTWYTVSNLSDGTSNFTSSGTITFDLPGDWAQYTVGTENKYWIKVRSSSSSSVDAIATLILPTAYTANYLYEFFPNPLDTYLTGGISIDTNGRVHIPSIEGATRVNGALTVTSLASGTITGTTLSQTGSTTQTIGTLYIPTDGLIQNVAASTGVTLALNPLNVSPRIRQLSSAWDIDGAVNVYHQYWQNVVPYPGNTVNSKLCWNFINGSSGTSAEYQGPEIMNYYNNALNVLGSTYDTERLTNGSFTSPGGEWVAGGYGWTLSGGVATYTRSASGSGTLTQPAASMGTIKPNRWYRFTYSTLTQNTTVHAYIDPSGISEERVYLRNVSIATAGTWTTTFKTNAAPGDFIITAYGTAASDTCSFDDFSLVEVISGDLVANGLITGGGANGIKVDYLGNVGIGTASPSVKFDLVGNMDLTGVLTLDEESSIALDPAGSADEKWSGITVAGTAGATIAVGDLCYLDVTAGEWLLADADAASTSGDVPLGLCVLAAGNGDPTVLLLIGTMRSATFPASIALGAPVYVSTTAGDVQAAQPSDTDDVIRRVGWAITVEPNTIYFNPSNDYITHT